MSPHEEDYRKLTQSTIYSNKKHKAVVRSKRCSTQKDKHLGKHLTSNLILLFLDNKKHF